MRCMYRPSNNSRIQWRPPTSRRFVCRTGIAVIVFVQLARCTLVAMAEADFHVVKPVSCQQNWGIPGWHSYLQCCYDFPRRCSDRQGNKSLRDLLYWDPHDVSISFDSKIVQILRSETESKQFCVPKTRPTRIHRPMKSMTFETDEILHFGDMYQARRAFLEIHRTDESDEIDEI